MCLVKPVFFSILRGDMDHLFLPEEWLEFTCSSVLRLKKGELRKHFGLLDSPGSCLLDRKG